MTPGSAATPDPVIGGPAATEVALRESVLLDHGFSTPMLVAVAALCLVVLLGSLTRERRVLGSPLTSLFGVLRTVALVTAFWMILSPTAVSEQTTTTRKAVAILTDTSASMATVDPPGTADDRRWDDLAADDPIARADRSIAALGIAGREIAAAVADLDRLGATDLVTGRIARADAAVGQVRSELAALGRDVTGLERPLVARLVDLIDSPEYDNLSELARMLRRGQLPPDPGWREGLSDLQSRTVIAGRVFAQLAEQLSEASPGPPLRSPRSVRVAKLLRRLDKSALPTAGQTADIRLSTFDRSAAGLPTPDAAASLMQTLEDRDGLARQTDLAVALASVDQLRQTQPVAAAIVLSDVAHNAAEGDGPAVVAERLADVPVYVVPIGSPKRRRDVGIVSVSAPSVAMRNDDIVVEVQIEAYQCLGESVAVQLIEDGEVVDFRPVPIESDAASRSVQFDRRVSQVGQLSLGVNLVPLDGEATTANNATEIAVNVTRSDIKVLLADELPRWEYRYLSQLFRRDPKVEVDTLLFRPRTIATGRREASGRFPATADEWDQYDVVMLGDLPPERLPEASQQSLVEYVRTRGGTVILTAGPLAMPAAYARLPLSQLVPVRPTDQPPAAEYAFRVTDDGQEHIALMIGQTDSLTRQAWAFVNQFSPLHQVSRWRQPLPSATSLIAALPRGAAGPSGNTEAAAVGEISDEAADEAQRASTFLCWQPVGRGRAVYLSAPDTYRLRFLRGDHFHYRFWGQLMRWAIASDLATGNSRVRLRTLKTKYDSDQPVDLEVDLFGDDGRPLAVPPGAAPALELIATESDSTEPNSTEPNSADADTPRTRLVELVADSDRPGTLVAAASSLPPGEYRAVPSGTFLARLVSEGAAAGTAPVETAFTIAERLPAELVDTRSGRVLASQIAELTGGQVLPPTAVASVLALTDLDPIVTRRVEREPLWLRWRYLWLIFGCLQIEWAVRKWRGLS